jgi:hypothetical protein
MPVTRFAEDPLLSEDETLRRAALLALGRAPTPDSARAILRALLHFMQDTPALAEPFVTALITPPMARIAEDPILELMDHAEEAVREQAAFMLYRIRLRETSRARLVRALKEDRSGWVRAYASKALALLGGADIGTLVAEAIDNEATPEAVSRMAEALALLGRQEHAHVLADQAEQLWERSESDPATAESLQACALFVEALATRLDASVELGTLEGVSTGAQTYTTDSGTLRLLGGADHLGFAAKVKLGSGREVVLPQDSSEALKALG